MSNFLKPNRKKILVFLFLLVFSLIFRAFATWIIGITVDLFNFPVHWDLSGVLYDYDYEPCPDRPGYFLCVKTIYRYRYGLSDDAGRAIEYLIHYLTLILNIAIYYFVSCILIFVYERLRTRKH